MPNSKAKKTVKVIKSLRNTEVDNIVTAPSAKKQGYTFAGKLIIIALLGSLAYLLAFKYRNLILAGTINNFPVSRMELNKKLVERYGKNAFEEIVNEKLLSDQIKKNNIVVTDEEVNADIEKMVKQYGSQEAYESALTQFGLTPEKAKISIKQSIGFKKLIEQTSKIEITDEAIKAQFETSKDTVYKGKKLEEVSASIKDGLYQQELYTKSQEMFTNIRKEAKVNSFI